MPATSDSEQLGLVLQINSADTPLVMSLFFKIAGVKGVSYNFKNSKTLETFPAESLSSDPAGDTVNAKFTTPIAADRLVITLTGASADSVMTVERLSVKACFSPGKL